jgi:tetratricopeptide (TPR) repeat protein
VRRVRRALARALQLYGNAHAQLRARALEQELGLDHEETAAALNALGTCYKALGMYEEAEPLLARAGPVLVRHGSTEARLRVEHNVCALYLQRGQYAEATVRVRAALEAALKSLPADHLLVGSLKLLQVNLLALQVPSATRARRARNAISPRARAAHFRHVRGQCTRARARSAALASVPRTESSRWLLSADFCAHTRKQHQITLGSACWAYVLKF